MRHAKKIAVAGAVLLAGATASIAVAAIPDSTTGVFHACVQNVSNNGRMIRMIDAENGETCPTGYTEKTWNQQGPIGPTGPTGPVGAAGDPASVPSGTLYGAHTSDLRETLAPRTALTGFNYHCPVDKPVILSAYTWAEPQDGSGIGQTDTGSQVNSEQADGLPTGVNVVAWNHTDVDVQVRTVLICASKT